MANELAHKTKGTQLTQAEYEHIDAHLCDSQAQGDIIYASSATQLSRLGAGNAGEFLQTGGASANPAWAAISRKNAIINGGGIVNQRNSAYTLVKDAYNWDTTKTTGPDMFEGMATGTAVSAGTYNNIATANCGVSGYAFKFIAVTLTGAGEIHHRYRMEAKDAVRFKNQTASFRCQVYQDTGGAINYTIYVRKANAADDFAAVTAISNSGAISVPNITATSLPYLAIAMGDCSNGIEIEIVASAGAVTTKNFEFTEYQLELGSVATPFEFRPYGQELALCQRYTVMLSSVGLAYGVFMVGYWSSTSAPAFWYQMPVPMRIRPSTITTSAAGSFVTHSGAGAGVDVTTAPSIIRGTNTAIQINVTCSGATGTAGWAALLQDDGASTAYILLTAEL